MDYYKETAHAHAYKYELMKSRAQEELRKRVVAENRNKKLESEILMYRGMVSMNGFLGSHSSNLRPNMGLPYLSRSSFDEKDKNEASSIESIEVPKSLKVRARSPKKQ